MKKNNRGLIPLETTNHRLGERRFYPGTHTLLLLRRRQNKKQSLTGFTMIEILLVVIIIGILASLIVPRLSGRSEEARRQAAKADIMGGLALALDLYEADTGKYPSQLNDLLKEPSGVNNWRGPYLKRGISKDPWGSDYVYQAPGIYNTESYDLFSSGPDRKEGTDDDVTNWNVET
ncbi:MAG: type II secretion system protein GspG [Candidatus Omnitrophica bacterium CG11_big_fil_rev_8_21_14_0_20_45_26]|uniref:Type II secretion system core protein G n=1 Tax=Candidatus Abzuiibacterium crystallinum TaxID=1974748 RepID=A0A2H0LNM3_9BACT|nr:MAG: type II secretion system protein GspG [Candidatus Omnitrophica bacterium CG11_big_fil_rev_8_21_14_0_20_45_26]PIW64523.1 MAG: type II secretion system protein GspG [Candidatus Omnitrophica bacterium CG12_big_fil_rev_8_21_14_0_65_45_16]